MLETVKGHAPEGTKIIAHIGAGHFDDTKELLMHSNEVGVDAVSSLPPSLTTYYSPEEIIEYYKYIASHSNSPVLAYVHPTTLKCDVMWFVNKIMEIDNMIGIKLTVPDYYIFEKIRSQYGEGINILNGPDECLASGLLVGADGAIGTSYNLMPATACKIYDCFTKGDFMKAREYQQKLNRVIEILLGHNLAFMKIPLTVLGIDIGYTAEPAHMPDKAEADEILK